MRKIIPVVAGCIVQEQPLRVLLHRKDEPRNPELLGKWEFPGGIMEYGEDPKATLIRELQEELGGYIVRVGDIIHAQCNIYVSGTQYLVLFYKCRMHPKFAPDGCEWFRKQDVAGIDCLPGTQEVLKKIFQQN